MLLNLENGFDWHSYALQTFGSHWPNYAQTWLHNISEDAQKTDIENTGHFHLPPTNLLLSNRLQRVIAINIQRMFAIAKGTLPFDAEPLRFLIQETTGTGEAFIITAITYIARRIFQRNSAVMNLSLTGTASVLLPNGRTVHSTTPPPRTMKKKEFSTAQLTDYPISDVALSKLRVHTGTHVDHLKLICLNLDERGMWSNIFDDLRMS